VTTAWLPIPGRKGLLLRKSFTINWHLLCRFQKEKPGLVRNQRSSEQEERAYLHLERTVAAYREIGVQKNKTKTFAVKIKGNTEARNLSWQRERLTRQTWLRLSRHPTPAPWAKKGKSGGLKTDCSHLTEKMQRTRDSWDKGARKHWEKWLPQRNSGLRAEYSHPS